MRLIRLIAQEALTYQTRAVGAGEVFEAAPIDAAVLTYRRQAIFASRGTTPAAPAPVPCDDTPGAAPDPKPEKPKRRRQTYKRRDLRAED
jgi:hypothetical protein